MNGTTNLSILVSDVLSAAQHREELQGHVGDFQERLQQMSSEIEEWKRKLDNSEKEKQKLLGGMQKYLSNSTEKTTELQSQNKALIKYVRKLEGK